MDFGCAMLIRMSTSSPIPSALIEAFAYRLYLPLQETARLLRLCPTTLREHVRLGHIRYVQIGSGTRRITRMFRLSDVTEFLERQSQIACPSDESPRARSGGSTSPTRASGFEALRSARRSERLKLVSDRSASA